MIDLRQGDCLKVLRTLDAESVNCIVTSPPYWGLRDYGVPGQMGLEWSFCEYLERMAGVFEECRRVLRKDGTMWVNMGDAYSGSWGAQSRGEGDPSGTSTLSGGQIYAAPKGTHTGSRKRTGLAPKNLLGQPWRLAFALQDAGWNLRSDIIWHKPNPMPESVTDRPTRAHEYLFLFVKSQKYWYDADALGDRSGSGANARTVWTIATQGYPYAHFATFPEELPKRCISAGCPPGGVVLDPFAGSGTTLAVAVRLGRSAIGIEINAEYIELARRRIAAETPSLFAGDAA